MTTDQSPPAQASDEPLTERDIADLRNVIAVAERGRMPDLAAKAQAMLDAGVLPARAAISVQASDEPMRTAFENCSQNRTRLAFKRGGTVFAENVPETEYFDGGVQASWIFWQEAYRAGIAEGRAYQRKVESKKAARRATKP